MWYLCTVLLYLLAYMWVINLAISISKVLITHRHLCWAHILCDNVSGCGFLILTCSMNIWLAGFLNATSWLNCCHRAWAVVITQCGICGIAQKLFSKYCLRMFYSVCCYDANNIFHQEMVNLCQEMVILWTPTMS